MFEKLISHFKLSWLFLTGREWHWHEMDFTVLPEDERTPEEKTAQYNKVLNEIPEEARDRFTLLYVSVCVGILLLLILAL